MKTLDDFKKEKPEYWRIFGPANKIIATLYFHETKGGLSKEQIEERLNGLEEEAIKEGLAFLKKYGEIGTTQKEEELRYHLPKKVRETFKQLYQLS